jgi:predicted metal-dependent phosphoesterase TrpH
VLEGEHPVEGQLSDGSARGVNSNAAAGLLHASTLPWPVVIDLHTHSSVSDGSEPPGRIAELAAAAGCSAFALTDHDNLGGLEEAAVVARREEITLVRGCEVSCKPEGLATGSAVHVLVYFVQGDDGPLQEELRALRADRLKRNRLLVDRLAELGVPVDYDEIVRDAGGEEGIGRPHFARALVKIGAAIDIDDAFNRWLGNGGPAYIPKGRLDPVDVARLAVASGAVAVLAHPLSLQLGPVKLRALAGELQSAGFGGFEAVYGRYSLEQREELSLIAREAGLVPTGGSDFHGSFKPDLAVGWGTGDLNVSDDVLEELAARRS